MTGVLLGSAFVALIALGWVAGMVTYRQSRRWCTDCGCTLRCTNCSTRARHT
jgi:hypothetical protein